MNLNERKVFMENVLYRQVLEMYLENKAAKGEPLPGCRGHISYKGISNETRIPRRQFRKGSELRLLVDASVEKLGVGTGPLCELPRRVLSFEGGTSPTTYGELKASGQAQSKEPCYSKATIASYQSGLNAFMRHFGRCDEDLTAQDFGVNFEDRLNAFLKATGRDKATAAALRFWARIEHELHRSRSLPTDIASALTDLVTGSGRTMVDIARDAGINPSTLRSWLRGDRRPASPELVAKVEEALGVPLGTLSQKAVFNKMRGVTLIPDDWWPESRSRRSPSWQYWRNKVLSRIPENLLTEPLEVLKPAFDEALQKVLRGEGEPTFRQNFTRLRVKRYQLGFRDWPDHLAAEFLALKAYRTAPRGIRTKNCGEKWGEETATMAQAQLENFFDFLCLPTDHPDPELRGMGLRPEDLTLAWLAVQDAVESYLDFRCLRSGAYNKDTETLVGLWGALLQFESGWLWLHPELLSRLPEEQQQAVKAAGGWETYCSSVRDGLRDSLKSLQRDGLIKQTRETMLLFEPILDHPEPLTLIDHALDLHRRDLEARSRPNELFSPLLAAHWRDHTLISLLARFPLRAKQLALLSYREDGSGQLQKHPRDGWRFMLPYSDFKNGGNKKIFVPSNLGPVLPLKFSDSELLEQLIPLLEFYLEHVRPTIVGQGDFLFPTKRGKSMRGVLHCQVTTWTREYLSQYSSRRLGIEGVHPFGPHAFRDIVATHVIKTTGSIALAANILLDSEDVVREHYARFLPEDRLKLAMAGMAAAFKKKGSK
jgi:integrase/transcriptional regulator with XRE-family HTH domain